MSAVAVVGGDIDSWCTRCKIMILHVVVVMKDDTNVPKRVECKSCGGTHMYRKNPPGTRKKKAAAGKPTVGKSALKASDYARLMEGRNPAQARRYSPKTTFVVGELIAHPKFGTGVSTLLKDTTKVEILFADGPKVLIHGRTPPPEPEI